MSRIDLKFSRLKHLKRKAFVAFLTAGDPDLKTTEDLLLSLEHSGADIIEIGVPFSDPLADGPTIQAASLRALKHGVNLPKIFELVRRVRKSSDVPLALMTYYNPVFHYGEERFVRDLKACGADGVIIPDLPPEEAENLIQLCRKADISTIFFLAPTTTPDRAKKILKASTGFVYYVSVTGVTGARQQQKFDIESHIRQIKKISDQPICVGFGVSTPEQVKDLTRFADGVIVGSAIINEMVKHKGPSLVKDVAGFVKRLSQPLNHSS